MKLKQRFCAHSGHNRNADGIQDGSCAAQNIMLAARSFTSTPSAFRTILRLYYACPRCGLTMEREFTSFCDRCGQRLGWRGYRSAKIIYCYTYAQRDAVVVK